MPNITLSVPEEIYRRMKRRSDVRWSEVARKAIVERLEGLEGPEGFCVSAGELRKMIEDAGVELMKISATKGERYYRKMRELEWKRTSSIQAS